MGTDNNTLNTLRITYEFLKNNPDDWFDVRTITSQVMNGRNDMRMKHYLLLLYNMNIVEMKDSYKWWKFNKLLEKV
ncbi:MAG: hypothetical protein EOL97_15085 [Spirochaetia bacterium]|nr:hypothetical protein [Spirochaetia bacterium]